MIVGFHPFFDNPVRMGYVPGWSSISDLVERTGDLEHAVGESRIVPAHWEPFYRECPSNRYAVAYEWARNQLQNPEGFALALALFPGEEEQLTMPIGRADWLILSTKSEPSRVTRRIMLAEALELWERHATDWLQRIVQTCAELGVEISAALLQQQVQGALELLRKETPTEEDVVSLPESLPGFRRWDGFDKELMQMDGWTPGPGLVILPVDGQRHGLSRQILRLDLSKVALLKARKPARTVPWEKITLAYLSEGAVTFEVADESPLKVPGYRYPEQILTIVQECYKAATERILQSVARKVTRPVP